MLVKKQVILCLSLNWLSFLWGCKVSIPAPQSPAAKIYTDKCSSCHSLPHPKRHRLKEWRHYLELMQTHMERQGMPPLTEEEKIAILGYLQQHSR